MRKLILATASVLALGLAASGASYAHQGSSAQLPGSNTPSATMPSSTTPASTGMTQRGMRSTAPMHLSKNHLRQVQKQLKTAGLYKGEIDGKMGPDTRSAIMKFQKQNGLQGTGKLDQRTLAALGNNGNSGTSGSGSSTLPGNQPSNAGGLNGSSNPNLQPGMNGTHSNGNQPGASGNLNPSTTAPRH